MKLNLSTGTFYKLKIPVSDWEVILSNLEIDGVELTFKQWAEMQEIILNKDLIAFLVKYKYNTIHAPFGLIYNVDFESQFQEIRKLATSINAKHIVFHLYNFANLDLIEKINYGFTLENTMTGDWNGHKFVDYIRSTNYKITLDTSHCFNFGDQELPLLFNSLKNRILNIHLSNVVDEHHHRQFYSNSQDWSKVEWIFDELADDVLITLEENFREVEEISKEIGFIRKNLTRLN